MVSTSRPLHVRFPQLLVIVAFVAAVVIPVIVSAAGSSPFTLMTSSSPKRSAAVPLSGATVGGNAYIFLVPTKGITEVTFWLDDNTGRGTPIHVERSAPIDFAGTAADGKAKAWDSTSVPDGRHSIAAKIVTSSGTSSVVVNFTVSNGSSNPPTSKPSAGATPKGTPGTKPTPYPTSSGSVPPVPTPIPAGFVGASGASFTLGGRPFTFTGFNIYQANSRSNCSYTMGTGGALNAALTAIGPGAEVFRAWFFEKLATSNGARDWSAFDHTLAVARSHGVKVIATLGNQWGSCESTSSVYKSDAWYKSGYKTTVLPGNTVSYRQWVQEVVARYKNDPTIAMWQLMNEAEIKTSKAAASCSPTSDLYNFTADVSGLIKSIDSHHLVSLGTMGSGQCGSQGSDYKTLHSIASIDVCEYHDYGHPTQALPAKLAADIAACRSLGKPIFVGEAGIQPNAVGGTLAARAAAFQAKCVAMFKAGVGGFLVWSWNNGAPTTRNWPVGPGDPAVRVIDGY